MTELTEIERKNLLTNTKMAVIGFTGIVNGILTSADEDERKLWVQVYEKHIANVVKALDTLGAENAAVPAVAAADVPAPSVAEVQNAADKFAEAKP